MKCLMVGSPHREDFEIAGELTREMIVPYAIPSEAVDGFPPYPLRSGEPRIGRDRYEIEWVNDARDVAKYVWVRREEKTR